MTKLDHGKNKKIGQIELEIWLNHSKSAKNLTFDLLSPANKNFWKYHT